MVEVVSVAAVEDRVVDEHAASASPERINGIITTFFIGGLSCWPTDPGGLTRFTKAFPGAATRAATNPALIARHGGARGSDYRIMLRVNDQPGTMELIHSCHAAGTTGLGKCCT